MGETSADGHGLLASMPSGRSAALFASAAAPPAATPPKAPAMPPSVPPTNPPTGPATAMPTVTPVAAPTIMPPPISTEWASRSASAGSRGVCAAGRGSWEGIP